MRKEQENPQQGDLLADIQKENDSINRRENLFRFLEEFDENVRLEHPFYTQLQIISIAIDFAQEYDLVEDNILINSNPEIIQRLKDRTKNNTLLMHTFRFTKIKQGSNPGKEVKAIKKEDAGVVAAFCFYLMDEQFVTEDFISGQSWKKTAHFYNIHQTLFEDVKGTKWEKLVRNPDEPISVWESEYQDSQAIPAKIPNLNAKPRRRVTIPRIKDIASGKCREFPLDFKDWTGDKIDRITRNEYGELEDVIYYTFTPEFYETCKYILRTLSNGRIRYRQQFDDLETEDKKRLLEDIGNVFNRLKEREDIDPEYVKNVIDLYQIAQYVSAQSKDVA